MILNNALREHLIELQGDLLLHYDIHSTFVYVNGIVCLVANNYTTRPHVADYADQCWAEVSNLPGGSVVKEPSSAQLVDDELR